MSYAPGGGLPVDLANTLSALVVLAFCLLPAFGIAWGLGRRAGWPLGRILGLAFSGTLFVVGILSLAAHYAGLSLTATLAVSAVVFVALTVLGVRLARGTERPRSDWQGLLVATVAGVVALFERPWFTPADTFYHLAAIRSLLVFDRPAVTDPFYGTSLNLLDPTSGVWHSFLALVSRATHLDPAWLWPGATVAGAALTALGMWVLCRVVSRSPAGATLATAAFLLFSMHADMRWGAYPNRMSLSVVFFGLVAAVGLIDRPRYVLADAALGVTAGFAAISLHLAAAAVMLLVTLYLTVLVGLDVLDQRVRLARWEWQPFVALAATGAVLLVVALPMLVPKGDVVATSPLVSYVGGLAGMVKRWPFGLLSARPLMIGAGVGPQLVALALGLVALLAGFLRDDRRALAAGTVGTFTAVVFLDPLVATALLSRSAYLCLRIAILLPFAVFVPLAWGFGQLGRARSYCPGDNTRLLSIAGVGLAALGVVAAVQVGAVPLRDLFRPIKAHGVLGVSLSRTRDVRVVWGPERVGAVARQLGRTRYPVVAGTGETAYELAGLMPVALAAAPEKHAPFAFERIDGAQRRADQKLLLEPSESEAVRREIVRRRGIDFVVVDRSDRAQAPTAEALAAEPALFERVVDSPTLVLFRVKR